MARFQRRARPRRRRASRARARSLAGRPGSVRVPYRKPATPTDPCSKIMVPDPSPPIVGSTMRFAHFEFDPENDRLGEGPLSEVYRAIDVELGRTVALKDRKSVV